MTNRFFYRCGRCLFRFTADVEGRNPPNVEGCPVCNNSRVECLGSTQGRVVLTVPCDAKCVFAIGKTCDCSCGGKNHGSGLLVPVIRGVVDFSGARVPGYQQTAADYRAYLARLQSLRDSPPPAVAAALKAKADAGGGWVARGHYETLRDWEYTFSRIREGGTYKIRNQRIDAALNTKSDLFGNL